MLAFPMEEELQKYSFKELKKERKRILKEIKRFEKGKISEDEWHFKPSPKLKYDCNKEYLQTLEKEITIRKNNR